MQVLMCSYKSCPPVVSRKRTTSTPVTGSERNVGSKVRPVVSIKLNSWAVVKLVITRDFDSRILGSNPSSSAKFLKNVYSNLLI